jgi:phytoene dehydrogenase-like protein
MQQASETDYLILGSGMAGLTVGALLARAGHSVRILEAHEHPGGYAHSFPMGAYRFCAQVHYIFGCEPGGPVEAFLRAIGLDVPFVQLDPEGFDHIVVAGDRFPIPNGFDRFRDRLAARYPDERERILGYFDTLVATRDELARLPDRLGPMDVVGAPFRLPHVLRYRAATLRDVFDEFRLGPRVRAVIAGQAGDYLLPPSEVSFLLQVALVAGYDRGAYYPVHHYGDLVDRIVRTITDAPGCSVELREEVDRIEVEGARVARVHTKSGRAWTARTVISNIDPARTATLLGDSALPRRWRTRLRYGYSAGSFTMYLGLRGIDLRDHGFGSWNVWHYPHDDLDRIYADQVARGDLSDPWLFLSTPSLHSDAPGLAPPGHQVLEIATACSYEHFAALRRRGSQEYTREKAKVRDRILDVIEAKYVPRIREHIALKVVGSPTTNERFCWSPEGNAYGEALTPGHVGPSRVPFETPIENLFLCNATAGYPSVAGTVRSGQRLFALLAERRS